MVLEVDPFALRERLTLAEIEEPRQFVHRFDDLPHYGAVGWARADHLFAYRF